MCADERRSGQRILRRLARSGCRGFLLPIDRLDQVREEAGGGGGRVSERQKREAPLGAAGLQDCLLREINISSRSVGYTLTIANAWLSASEAY